MAYEIEVAIIGIVGTAVASICVYFAKRYFSSFSQLRKTISEVSYSMNMYAPIFLNPTNDPKHQEVSDIFRDLASRLQQQLYLIKYPRFGSTFLRIPSSKKNIDSACGELIGMSNNMLHQGYMSEIYESSEKVKKLLKI
jgi:hypothetical protein